MRKNKWKYWVWGAVAIVVTALVSVFYYYTTVQRPWWDTEKRAVRAALDRTPMEEAERTALSNSEESFVIVYGTDGENRPLIAWVESVTEDVYYAYPDQGTTEEQIRNRWRNAHPDARLIRIVPSLMRGEVAWEVFYEQEVEGGKRKYYDYYRFEDGELLVTYTLTLERP